MAKTFPVQVPVTALDRFTTPLGKMGGAAGRFGDRLKRIGRTLTLTVTAPLLAVGAASVKTGTAIQRSMNRVEVSTKASAEQMEGLKTQAEGLSGQTHTLSEVASGMELLSRKGEDFASIQAETPSVLRFSAIANMELGDSVDFLTGTLDAYGLEADRAAHLTDVLAAAGEKTDLADLLEALKTAGPALRSTNQDLENSISLFDALADAGFDGARGGSAVMAIMKKLTGGSRTGQKLLAAQFRALKIQPGDLRDSNGQLIELVDLVDLLRERGASARQVLRMFGQEGGSALAAMLERGTTAVRAQAAALEDVDGVAQKMVDTLSKGGADSTVKFADAWEKFTNELAQSGVLDMLRDVVTIAGEWSKKFQQLDPSTKRLTVKVAAFAAVAGPAIVTVGSLVQAVAGLAAAAEKFRGVRIAAGFGGIAAIAVSVHSIAVDMIDLWNAYHGIKSEAFGGPTGDRPAMDKSAFAAQSGAVAGEAIGKKRLDDAKAAGMQMLGAGLGDRAGLSGRIDVNFRGAPAGTKVRTTSDAGLDLFAGFNLGGAL